MWKRAIAKSALVLAVLGAYVAPAWAEEDAEIILRASHDYGAAHSFELQETAEQKGRILVPGKPPLDLPSTKETKVIDVDAANQLVRMTAKDQGKDVIVIRKGQSAAMRIGSGSWTKPQGPYARMGDQLANPFACPLPKRGEKQSPKWRIVGRELVNGEETTVIETVGDTAIRYAEERMREGIMTMFPDAAARPVIEVLDYKSRHWIGKDNRRLRVEQTSHTKMTVPGTPKTILDLSAKTTAIYSRYDKVEIRLPDEARSILEPK
jgi:hypothetical protein